MEKVTLRNQKICGNVIKHICTVPCSRYCDVWYINDINDAMEIYHNKSVCDLQ